MDGLDWSNESMCKSERLQINYSDNFKVPKLRGEERYDDIAVYHERHMTVLHELSQAK